MERYGCAVDRIWTCGLWMWVNLKKKWPLFFDINGHSCHFIHIPVRSNQRLLPRVTSPSTHPKPVYLAGLECYELWAGYYRLTDIKEKLINLYRDDIIRDGRKKNRGWSAECAKFHLLQNHFISCVSNLGKVPLLSFIVFFWQPQQEIGHGKYSKATLKESTPQMRCWLNGWEFWYSFGQPAPPIRDEGRSLSRAGAAYHLNGI